MCPNEKALIPPHRFGHKCRQTPIEQLSASSPLERFPVNQIEHFKNDDQVQGKALLELEVIA